MDECRIKGRGKSEAAGRVEADSPSAAPIRGRSCEKASDAGPARPSAARPHARHKTMQAVLLAGRPRARGIAGGRRPCTNQKPAAKRVELVGSGRAAHRRELAPQLAAPRPVSTHSAQFKLCAGGQRAPAPRAQRAAPPQKDRVFVSRAHQTNRPSADDAARAAPSATPTRVRRTRRRRVAGGVPRNARQPPPSFRFFYLLASQGAVQVGRHVRRVQQAGGQVQLAVRA